MGVGSRILVLVALGTGLAARANEPVKNSGCLECHADQTLTRLDAAGRAISLFVDAAELAASVHQDIRCAACHEDLTLEHPDDGVAAQPVQCRSCHARQSATHGASAHGQAIEAGRPDAATCQHCHGTHAVFPPLLPQSPLSASHQVETCGACHMEAARDFAVSVHGRALAAGVRDAPTCTDCHLEHQLPVRTGTAGVRTTAHEVCSRCHASERINTRYNLPPDRVRTFFDSYHGLASAYGSTVVANCASCHGYHKILPSSDSQSTIHPAHLVQTCGKCHPGATEKFALSKIHVDPATPPAANAPGTAASWWVRRIYRVLIAVTIGSMLTHHLLVLRKKLVAHFRSADRPIVRMNRSQRGQHAVLALSFIVLAVTGFALKFPDSWPGTLLGSSEPFRRWSHRAAGLVLLGVGVYHLGYLAFTREGRRLARDFLPTKKDLTEAVGTGCWLLGLRRDKPPRGRFGYPEKMEYWAVIWGTLVMGVTGLMVWFKMVVTHWLPRWTVDVALTIHYYEAILACLAILVWHFYQVIFDPDVYPLNLACWDGKVSRRWHAQEHPLDPSAQTPAPPSAAAAPSSTGDTPPGPANPALATNTGPPPASAAAPLNH